MYNYQYVEESVKFEKDNNPEVSQEDVFETLYNEVLDVILEELCGEVQIGMEFEMLETDGKEKRL